MGGYLPLRKIGDGGIRVVWMATPHLPNGGNVLRYGARRERDRAGPVPGACFLNGGSPAHH